MLFNFHEYTILLYFDSVSFEIIGFHSCHDLLHLGNHRRQILWKFLHHFWCRFNELKKRLGSISATSLTERLKELEQRGIVQRRVYPETPPRVEYSLTKKGRELHALLLQLADWVIRWNKKPLLISEPTEQKKAHC